MMPNAGDAVRDKRVELSFWLHRVDVDHEPTLGHLLTQADEAEIERQLDLPRYKEDGSVYTTRSWKSKKSAKESEAEAREDDEAAQVWDGVMPEPEVRADRSVVPWPLRASVPNGVWLILKPALAAGMEVVRLTYARGPWAHGGGQAPKTAETWVLTIRAPDLDRGPTAAIGCWRRHNDGSWKYDHGYFVGQGHAMLVASGAIKQWIKEAHSG